MNHSLLFAQSAPSMTNEISIGVVGVVLIVGAIATIIGLSILRNGRIANEERLRAMELGTVLPRRASRWPQAIFCTSVGVGVPLGMYLIMGRMTDSGHSSPEIWIGSCIVSVAAIVGATIVAGIAFGRSEPLSDAIQIGSPSGKPAHNPETLDFAGRIGHG